MKRSRATNDEAMNTFTEFAAAGVQVVPRVLTSSQVEQARMLIDPLLRSESGRARPGVRGVLTRAPDLIGVLRASRAASVLKGLLGPGAMVVRAIAFDKTPEANWMVPWHQDATIAVRDRIDVPGYGPWAVKDGEHHCQPPREIMERIVTLRIHLDDCRREHGPLRVLHGTHRLGLLGEQEIARLAESTPVLEPEATSGDAILTTPLAVHSSRRSARPEERRRVLHLDCAGIDLPMGLQWAEDVKLST